MPVLKVLHDRLFFKREMGKIKYFYLLVLVAIIHLTACSQPAKQDSKTTENSKQQQEQVFNSYYNNFARAVAGMKPDTSGSFNLLVKKASWIKYAANADTSWKKVFINSLDKIKLWADTELVDINKSTNTLFYPFSGPDFMYANTFFPNAKTYIMFGLERPGSVPNLNKMSEASLTQFFASVNQSLEDILSLGFFKTIKMSSQLNNASVDGVLPILLLFMARTGNSITDVNSAYIDNAGKIAVNDTLFPTKSSSRFGKGVEVSFFKNGQKDTTIRKVYYFSADLTEQGLAKNTPVKLYLQKLDTGVTTFIKSASYLMHNNLFATVRNTVLTKSKAVLQDDSGIAYHFFDKNAWKIALYGTYDKPIDVFSYCYQKDLNAAYVKGARPFGFKYGYGKGRNMLLARRIK